MKRKQRYMERGIPRTGLGEAADRALRNYHASGLVMPDDTLIRAVSWRIKVRKWLGEPVRSR